MRSPNSTFATTLSQGINACFWNTTPRSAPGPTTCRPSRMISPADGCMNPAMHERSVVLPQPDAPSATTKSPGSRPRLTLDRASVVRPDVPAYLTLTLRISSLLKGGLPVDNSPQDYRDGAERASGSVLPSRAKATRSASAKK